MSRAGLQRALECSESPRLAYGRDDVGDGPGLYAITRNYFVGYAELVELVLEIPGLLRGELEVCHLFNSPHTRKKKLSSLSSHGSLRGMRLQFSTDSSPRFNSLETLHQEHQLPNTTLGFAVMSDIILAIIIALKIKSTVY